MDTVKKPSTKSGRRRAVHFVLRDEDCPGLIEFLDSLENRMESKTVRAILFNWFEQQKEEGTVDLIAAAVRTIHSHQLAVLQRNVQPHLIGRVSASLAPERNQILGQAATEIPSLPVSTSAPPGYHPLSSTMGVERIETKQDRTNGVQEEPDNAHPARDEPGVGFLDSMLGI